jgi:hypothetical protein
LERFLQTWESTKDGWIRAIVNGEKIIIDQTLIAKQFDVSAKGTLDGANALVKEAQMDLKNIVGPNAFINKEQWNII